ncbi:MAG: hypothetical protein ACOYU4_02715 [Thermodesulfobacteriota bacterium]
MNILFVFDDRLNPDCLLSLTKASEYIELFPLTGNYHLIHTVENLLVQSGKQVKLIEAARLVDAQVARMGDKISEWSAALGELAVAGKTIKHWFLLDQEISTYWLSLMSEKNPLKTDIFTHIAQANAVEDWLAERRYDAFWVAVGNESLRKVFKKLGKNNGLAVTFYSVSLTESGFKLKVKHALANSDLKGCLAGALAFFFRLQYWKFLTGWKPARIRYETPSMIFVTYFPYLNGRAAEKGKFENKYATGLQPKLEKSGIKIFWILMFVFINGGSFREAVRLRNTMTAGGERLFFLEEFAGPLLMLKVFIIWFFQAVKYMMLERKIIQGKPYENLTSNTCLPLVIDLLRNSFCGITAIQGIFYYYAYKKVFQRIPFADYCLYLAEMQSWEKALNAAARKTVPRLKIVGYQHSSISKNYFFYFPAPSEIRQNGKPTDLPLPTVFACNGELPYRLLERAGYDTIVQVEALRQIHLVSLLQKERGLRKESLLLVAGSIIRQETRDLISLVNAAFPKANGMQIWLKGHPSLPMEEVLSDLSIDNYRAGYVIKNGDIGDYLSRASAVLVPTSTVAVEALAYGCNVLVPVFSSTPCMSPLVGFEEYYRRIYSPPDLVKALEDINSTDWNDSHSSVTKKREFVTKYWCLDPSLHRWSRLLQMDSRPTNSDQAF